MANAVEARMERLEASAHAHGVILQALVSNIMREKPDPGAALAALFDDVNAILDLADDLPQLRSETAAIRKRIKSFFTTVQAGL